MCYGTNHTHVYDHSHDWDRYGMHFKCRKCNLFVLSDGKVPYVCESQQAGSSHAGGGLESSDCKERQKLSMLVSIMDT